MVPPWRQCSPARWLAILALFLCIMASAQPQGSPPGPAAAATADASGSGVVAGAAECTLHILGGESGIRYAGMRCTGPRPTIALAAKQLAGFQANFTGVDINNSSCNGRPANASACLMTICGGRLVLRDSTVLGVRGISSASVVCLVGNSRVHVHNSRFTDNLVRPLAVSDRAHLVLHASTVSDNSVKGAGGGVVIEGRANVTITDRSSVHGNRATGEGGGLVISGNAALEVAGSSSVSGNSAGGDGGGVCAVEHATIIITGGSSVHENTAKFGGALAVISNASVILTGGSSVYSNTAGAFGGGFAQQGDDGNASVTITGGSSVHSNRANEGFGGGLALVFGARLVVSNQSTVSNNECNGCLGGGISVGVHAGAEFSGSGRVQGQRITGYDPTDGVASHVTISNSTITNNSCNFSAGGAFAVSGSSIVELVDGTVVSYNSAVNGSGGGAVLLFNATLRTDDSVLFVDNTASQGYIGSTIAAFDNTTLQLRGNLTKCSVGVYLGWFPCRAGEVLMNDMCVCCPQHTFSFTNVSCLRCPGNADCTDGNLVVPWPGYWSSAPTSIQMHRCPLSTTACNYTRPMRDSQVAVKCNEGRGYTGPLCGACKFPDFGMLSPFRCGKCMRPSVQLGVYMLVSFVSVFFVLSTVHATWRDNLTGRKVVLDTDLIKVLVQFLQYTVIIGGVAVPWPLFDVVQRWFQAVNIVFAVGSGQALSLDCWLYHYFPQSRLPLAMQRQLVYFLAPVFVLVAVVALQWLVWALGRWVVPLVWRPKEGTAQRPAMLVIRKLPVTLLVLTFYAYPTLLRAALSFFACLVIDRDTPEVRLTTGATAPLDHKHGYWVSDIEQQCFAGYHWAWALGLGAPSVLLWCVAVPVALGVGLYVFRAKADSDSFREHFGFLYRSYRPERMWWEAVWAARTVILTCISVFSLPMERYFAVLSLLVVFLVSAALQSIFQPYAFAKLHRMHMVSTSCLLATTLGALAMFAYDIQEQTAEKLRIAIAVLVMLVNVAFVGWCLWKLVPVVREWCVSTYKKFESAVLWLVAAVLACAGRKKAGQGRGRRHRGSA